MRVSRTKIVGTAYADYLQVWDCKPENKDEPINWVELKTSVEIENERDTVKYERKLLKFWIQSFLLGVPKIIVGFRSKDGILQRLEELETRAIPGTVKRRGKGSWDGNVCINFTACFLDCEFNQHLLTKLTLNMCRVKADYYWRRGVEASSAREILNSRSIQAGGDWPWGHFVPGISGLATATRI